MVIGESLRQVTHLFLHATQRGVDAGVTQVELQGLLKLQFGGSKIAVFFVEASELHAGIRRLRAGHAPVFHQLKCLIDPLRLRQQHGQTAVAIDMVGVIRQTLPIE